MSSTAAMKSRSHVSDRSARLSSVTSRVMASTEATRPRASVSGTKSEEKCWCPKVGLSNSKSTVCCRPVERTCSRRAFQKATLSPGMPSSALVLPSTSSRALP
ncbi:MAG: hypothetical protein QM765_26330 [Myxococcales bacterium]